MAKRKQKSERVKLKEKCLLLAKQIAKARDKNTCQYCGKKVEGIDCQGSHVIPVSRDGRLAVDPLNIKVLCAHHHLQGWHLHPVEFGTWFKKTFPKRLKYLEKKHLEHQSLGTIGIGWWRDRHEQLKIEAKDIL